MRAFLANQWVVGILVNLVSTLILYLARVTRTKISQHLSRKKRSRTNKKRSRRAQIKYLVFKTLNFIGFFFNATMLIKLVNSPNPPSRWDVLLIFTYAGLALYWFYRAFIRFRGYSPEDWE
jgi:hypothetical protein